jgi:RecB family exonuclease
VITPRATRLIRTADLRHFQRAIAASVPRDPADVASCVVLVPTRGAAEELRRTLERVPLPHLPDIVTRDEWYERIRERLVPPPRPLSTFDREVLLRGCAHAAHAAGAEPPFNLRAGLIGEILALYDELRRRHRTVADFDRLMTGALEPGADYDRGASRLLAQTRFLTATFEAFEAALSSETAADEHRVRALALASEYPVYRQVIVTIPDQSADRHGLWTADFDLLARMPHLAAIDVIATDALLETGYYQRLHESIFPGIEDVRLDTDPSPPPILLVPDSEDGDARAFVCRDREEELAEFARVLAGRADRAALDRTGIVFQRPLPYLYLARQVFGDAGLPYQALDSLPLAGEPYAAAIDLIFSVVAADYTRGALLELLRSPHFRFTHDGQPITIAGVHALDRWLVDRKFLGGVDRLSALAADEAASSSGRGPALGAAASAARALAAAAGQPSAAAQIDAFLQFLISSEQLPADDAPWRERHMRARGAILSALQMLRDSHARHDTGPLSVGELSGAVRRWIEGQTFSPRLGMSGVTLLDATAAPYADLDDVRIVGLSEADWPERSSRSIFYPQSLLAQLGWPSDQDRVSASRTRFQNLLRLPRRRVSLSVFTLEDDSIVSPSPLLEDIDAVGLPVERLVPPADTARPRVFVHEALAIEPVAADAVAGDMRDWLALRTSRTFDSDAYRGAIGRQAPAVYAVSRLERYLECPFKYFAAHVLKLPEEREEQAWMTPQERGHFVHEVFESFFTEWQQQGGGAITIANVGDAMTLFHAVAERHLAELPEGDRALERTLLLGSAAAAGFGERAFAFEIEDALPVLERLLEHELQDTFSFTSEGEARRVTLRSKADRIDLLADGTFRIVDYKIGRAPERKRSLQLPIYGSCARQSLEGRNGRSWTLARAGYIAFKEKNPFVELQNPVKSVAEGEARLIGVVDALERGEFPVRPDEPFLCNWCAYPSLCRKDYVGDDL